MNKHQVNKSILLAAMAIWTASLAKRESGDAAEVLITMAVIIGCSFYYHYQKD
jgi:hypothetical protein